MGLDAPLLELPAIDGAEHVVEYLFAIGPAVAGERITFGEIRAWSEATGRELTAWEAEMLAKLSGAYLAEYQAASDPKRPPPSRES